MALNSNLAFLLKHPLEGFPFYKSLAVMKFLRGLSPLTYIRIEKLGKGSLYSKDILDNSPKHSKVFWLPMFSKMFIHIYSAG